MHDIPFLQQTICFMQVYSKISTLLNNALLADLEWSRPRRKLESITKPRLSTGSEFCISNRFPRGHYLVWWVRVRVSLGVRVRVRVRVMVSNLLGSL